MHERKNQLLYDTVGCFLMFLNEQENETGLKIEFGGGRRE